MSFQEACELVRAQQAARQDRLRRPHPGRAVQIAVASQLTSPQQLRLLDLALRTDAVFEEHHVVPDLGQRMSDGDEKQLVACGRRFEHLRVRAAWAELTEEIDADLDLLGEGLDAQERSIDHPLEEVDGPTDIALVDRAEGLGVEICLDGLLGQLQQVKFFYRSIHRASSDL